jgi:hypothetical protein
MDLLAVGLNASRASIGALDGPALGAALARAEARVRALTGVRESVRLVRTLMPGSSWALPIPFGTPPPTPRPGRRGGIPPPRRPGRISNEARRILAEEAGTGREA